MNSLALLYVLSLVLACGLGALVAKWLWLSPVALALFGAQVWIFLRKIKKLAKAAKLGASFLRTSGPGVLFPVEFWTLVPTGGIGPRWP